MGIFRGEKGREENLHQGGSRQTKTKPHPLTLWFKSCTSSKLTSLYMSSAVSQFELRPDELKLDDLYRWLAKALDPNCRFPECLIEPHRLFGRLSLFWPLGVELSVGASSRSTPPFSEIEMSLSP
uniref:(northern house mosquito) hypothetical protein n=1 Tax=Culex pipiens TaxID=7175 RepID=A0A8D8EUS9_CULPI